jgi:hypothetical protein
MENCEFGVTNCLSIARRLLSFAGRRLLQRTTDYGPRTPFLLCLLLFLLAQFIIHNSAFPQQPQAQAGQQIFPVNAKFVQGFGPGYWPTAGSNLTLNLAPGTSVCTNVVHTYAGGTLTLAPSATNYVYLNPSNNCAPASNTTGFATATIPIATVVTTSTAISSITDVRTMFVSSGVTSYGSMTSVGMTGDGIIFSPTVSGSPVTSSGTLAPQLLTQTANTVLAGPGSGPSATPTFRSLAAADLPATISSNTTGNSATASALVSTPTQCSSNNWATGISTSGNANCLQPGFSNLTGSLALGQTPLTTAGDLLFASSTPALSRLPVGETNQFLGSSGGMPAWMQPTFTNLSGTATISQGGTGQTTASGAFNSLSPLSTEGDLLYYHASANTRLAAGGNGQCLVSNGTDPVWGTCSGSSSFAWSSLVNPAASLTLSMSTYPSTFNHNSAVNWTWANTTAATSGTAQSSPLHNLSGTYWNGSASATDGWSLQDVVANGTNGSSTLTLSHSGSTGSATVSVPSLTNASTTQYGVMYGGGSSAAEKSTAAGASGLPLLGQGSAAPAFGTLGIGGGGTGQTTASAAFNALSPLTTEGDLHYYHSSSNARLGVGGNGQCLTSNGTDPYWGSCGSGSGSGSGLGNGTTVIDASLEAGADFSIKVNAAIAACSPGPCIYDLRGFSGNQTMSENIQFPAGSDVYMPAATITRASGVQFIVSNNSIHIHGPVLSDLDDAYGTVINSANTTNDYSPVFYGSNPFGLEIDHIQIGLTTNSSGPMPITSVGNAVSGNTTYTGTFTACATNACAGMSVGVFGMNGANNEGYYTVVSSTSTQLVLANTSGTAETPANNNPPTYAFATIAGGWGIVTGANDSNFHDIEMNSDLGIQFTGGQLGSNWYYNRLDNLQIHTSNGALYFGPGSTCSGTNLVLWARMNDSSNFAAATGYGLRVQHANSIQLVGVDIENTKYSIQIKGGGVTINNLYLENDGAYEQGVSALAMLPTLEYGSSNNIITGAWDVIDNSLGTTVNPTNVFASATTPKPLNSNSYGSFQVVGLANPSSMPASATNPTNGTTTYQYYLVAVDGNGNKSLPEAYSPLTNASALSSTSYNLLNRPQTMSAGTKCYDILVGDTAHSLVTCYPPSLFPYVDYGSLTAQAYNAPTRNATGDLHVAGALSTANNTLDDGSGNITAANGVTAPKFCVGSNCVTSLWSNPMTTLGDLLYAGASGAATRLGGNTSTTPMYLKSLGSGSAATAPTLTQIQFTDVAGTLGIGQGGTGQTTASAAFNALSPMTTEGDVTYYHSSSATRLAVGSNGQFLTSNGTDPVWGSGVSSFSGDGSLITNSSSTGAVTATLHTAGANQWWGNNTGSTAAPGYQSIGTQDVTPNLYANGGGTAQAQTVMLSPAPNALTPGLVVVWKPTAANTGAAPTLAVNGLTAKTITKCGTTALLANDLSTSIPAIAIYDGAEFQLLNPGQMAVQCGGTASNALGSNGYALLRAASTTTGAISSVANGTAKQVLTSGGSGASPSWIDFPEVVRSNAATCNNTTGALALWSLPTSSAPTLACRTGTNVQAGVLQFSHGNTAQFPVDIPSDYDSSGTVYAKVYFTQAGNTTSGQTIIMQMATGCSSTTDDPSFNTAQAFGTATTTGTAQTPFTESLSSVTMTGCAAGGNMNVQISRSSSDTATTAPNVYWVSITFPRLLTLQAN